MERSHNTIYLNKKKIVEIALEHLNFIRCITSIELKKTQVNSSSSAGTDETNIHIGIWKLVVAFPANTNRINLKSELKNF